MRTSDPEYAKERRTIAASLLGLHLSEEGTMSATDADIRSAFEVADKLLKYEEPPPFDPVELDDKVLSLVDWLLSQLHRFTHGTSKAVDWRRCAGGHCQTARARVAEIAPEFVKIREEGKSDAEKARSRI